MAAELEQSHVIDCTGCSYIDCRNKPKPVHALLRVYKDGEVRVNCKYLHNENQCIVGSPDEDLCKERGLGYPCTYLI